MDLNLCISNGTVSTKIYDKFLNSSRIILCPFNILTFRHLYTHAHINPGKKGKRKVQGVSQSQATTLPRRQEEEETEKTKHMCVCVCVCVCVCFVVVVLFVVCCCFFSTRRLVSSFAWCYFVLVFFSPLSIAITSLGEERANLSAFRTFVRFALVWFFSVSSSSWRLGRVVACDCDTPWTFLLPFLPGLIWACVYRCLNVRILNEHRIILEEFRNLLENQIKFIFNVLRPGISI